MLFVHIYGVVGGSVRSIHVRKYLGKCIHSAVFINTVNSGRGVNLVRYELNGSRMVTYNKSEKIASTFREIDAIQHFLPISDFQSL